MVTKSHIVIGTAIVMFAVTVVFSSMAKNQHITKRKEAPSDTRDGLQLSVELNGRGFRLDAIPTLTVLLENVSRSPITIYKNLGWGRSSSLTLSVLDGHDRMVRGTSLADASHVPPFPREDFTTIQPGETVKKEAPLGLRDEGIKVPGIYKIVVWYHSPIPRNLVPQGLEIWAMENGVLQSKAVTFEVTQQ